MKKGIRNKIILWFTISFVVFFALPNLSIFLIESETSTETTPTETIPTETIPTETIPIEIPPTDTPPIAINNLSHRDIVYSARYAIRQCLLSPSFDSFPVWPDNSYGVTKLANNTYLVSGKVATKNAYGVKLQNTWITKLEFSGNNLETVRAIFIKMNNEVLLDVP